MKAPLLCALVLLVPTSMVAQDTEKGSNKVIVEKPAAIQYGPAPGILPAGAKLAVLAGDPSQPGEFTMRLWMPAGYRIPPHFHPKVEHVTVVEGIFLVGMGETFTKAGATALPAGTFAALPPGMRHFAWTEAPATIQLHGAGPWSLTYVNPADDPRNGK
ncbi:MAG: cupin domain-containing protein [Gemmatimonadota bacterium]